MEPTFDDYAFAQSAGFDAGSQIEAMDREGIDIAVQYPSRGLFVLGADTTAHDPEGMDPAVATAIARAYNDWLADFCAEDPARMIGAGMIAPHDIRAAVDETRRVVEELGFKSIFLLPGVVGGRPWHHGDYDPLWAECERLDIPVVFHAHLRWTPTQQLANPLGFVHGGYVAVVVDDTCGVAVSSLLREFRPYPTASLQLDFYRGIRRSTRPSRCIVLT